MDANTPRRGIQSVEIAYRLLAALQRGPNPLSLTELAARAALSPSSAHNYLVSLVRTGLATAGPRPGSYHLGPAALALGWSALEQLDGFETVRQEASTLRDRTGQGAVVSIWTDNGPVIVFKKEGDRRGMLELRTGQIPLISTAAGKVFIAHLPPASTAAIVAREWPAGTGGAAAQDKFLRATRRTVRQFGYATLARSNLVGYASIAAPVWDWNDDVRFTLSIIGPRETIDLSGTGQHARALLESVARASTALGGSAERNRPRAGRFTQKRD